MNQPVEYMTRTREFYFAQGYEKAYVWAHFDDVPFATVRKSLNESVLGLVTTSAQHARQPFEPRQVASGPTDPGPERLYALDLAWAKESTHMDDLGSYFPLRDVKALVGEGRLGGLAKRFHCAPTSYSQRQTLEKDAPQIHAGLLEDGADVALLVPL